MNRRARWAVLAGAGLLWAPLGCDDDEPGGLGPGGQGATCGTEDAPQLLATTNVVPSVGVTVVNAAIVHAFTIVDPPMTFQGLNLMADGAHTAGNPILAGGSFSYTITYEGANERYEFVPIAWQIAPGQVSMTLKFATTDGCWYASATKLFDYGVTAGSGGSGVGGEGGGTGGAAGGAGGGGGSGGGG